MIFPEKANGAHPLGSLFIVAAPSGGGKTSLVHQLIAHMEGIELSISHTTRRKRPAETHGIDYFFIEPPEFQRMIDQGEFVEHAQVFEHSYGTSFAQITSRLEQGVDMVLDIDWQGAQQIKSLFPAALSIFIVPPSLDVLRERLISRQQDDNQVIAYRMLCAQDEMRHFSEFDFLIVNDDFSKAAAELTAIVQAERLRISRQTIQQRKLLSFLLTSR